MRLLTLAVIFVCGCLVFSLVSESERVPNAIGDKPVAGLSSVASLQSTYNKWAAAYRATAPKGPAMTVLWNRGLSREHSSAKGIVQLDLERNLVSVRIKGIEDTDIADVWLVQNRPGEGRSILPEDGDRLVLIGSLTFNGRSAWLDTRVEELGDLLLDVVVIARRDMDPGRGAVLVGTTSLFQKKFHYAPARPSDSRAASKKSASLSRLIVSTAHASAGVTPPHFSDDFDSNLVNFGRAIFFNETFSGNGRTCGTCHVEADNMALTLSTIAELPASDPLFIVEQLTRADGSVNALYNEFRFEKPALMRKVGLILENLDGFRDSNGDFTSRVAMRAPPHVLSMRTTLAPPPAFSDDGTLPIDADDLVFAERTGWSGDGTPTGFREDFFESSGRDLTGSLRDFAIGAVIQHFPLTLERSGFATDNQGNPRQPDFRFPTEAELDAMEAFMLSLGRLSENDDLNTVRLTDEIADRGRLNYLGFNVFDATPNDGRPPLNCQACHFNGGANTNPEFPFPPAVTPNHDLEDLAANGGSIASHNRSFGPAVERLADQAADIIVQVVDDPSVAGNCFSQGLAAVPLLPGDSAATPSQGCSANPIDNGFAFGIGDASSDERIAADRFNVPPVFEAMDNPPFFHAHQVNTIEGSVAFYATNRHFRNGEFAGAIVPLNAAQVSNVARFMRVMGADFNAAQAKTLLAKAAEFSSHARYERRINVRLAVADIRDALELLRGAEIHLVDAQPMFRDALLVLEHGRRVTTRRHKILTAIAVLDAAQEAMIIRSP